MEIRRDPLLSGLWGEFCMNHLSQGLDPNKPPAFSRPFREFANHRMNGLIETLGTQQYAGWRTVGEGELTTRRNERSALAERVRHSWREALEGLDLLISVAEEFGLVHVHRLQGAGDKASRKHALLIHLHSRGVQVSEEILALLRAGFAAGAEARWRTLHETAVVAAFIARHGDDVVERFTEHDQVRVKRAMEAEQEHHEALGLEPYSEEEMRAARDQVIELKQRYGPAFLGDYGWAAEALGRNRDGKSPSFVDIEASLDLRVSRVAYRSASEAIHAGPGALSDNPGSLVGSTPVFLTCGTEFGLLEPGIRTAGSLSLLSRALMDWRPFPFDLISLHAMRLMVSDVAALFWASEGRLTRARSGESC